jgi:hypothetical protein
MSIIVGIAGSIVRNLGSIVSAPPAFSPLDLFAGGEKGFWYDPSDLSTLFQDSAATTAVASDGDPVGNANDKSGNDNDATQSVSASRPTYKNDDTIDFDGVDDHLFIVDSQAGGHDFTDWSGAISFHARVTPENINDAGAAGVESLDVGSTIVCLRTEGSHYLVPFCFGFDEGSLTLGAGTGLGSAAQKVASSSNFTNGVTYDVGFSIDGDDWTIYIDGSATDTGTFTGAAGDRSVGNNTTNLTFGARSTDSGSDIDQYQGNTSNVVLIDKVLTAQDFSDLAAL